MVEDITLYNSIKSFSVYTNKSVVLQTHENYGSITQIILIFGETHGFFPDRGGVNPVEYITEFLKRNPNSHLYAELTLGATELRYGGEGPFAELRDLIRTPQFSSRITDIDNRTNELKKIIFHNPNAEKEDVDAWFNIYTRKQDVVNIFNYLIQNVITDPPDAQTEILQLYVKRLEENYYDIPESEHLRASPEDNVLRKEIIATVILDNNILKIISTVRDRHLIFYVGDLHKQTVDSILKKNPEIFRQIKDINY